MLATARIVAFRARQIPGAITESATPAQPRIPHFTL